MNDNELDQELQALFEAESLSIDANGATADALLEQVLMPASETYSFESGASVGSPVLDVNEFNLRQHEEERSPRWLVVAAVLAMIAALGVGSWAIGSNDRGPVLSDDVPENGLPDDAENNGAAGELEPIVGPSDALVTIANADLDGRFADVLRCSRTFEAPWGPPVGASPSLSFAFGLPPVDAAPDVIQVDEGTTITTCTPDGQSYGAGSSELLSLSDPSSVLISGSGGRSTGAFEVEGRLGPDVVEVRLLDPLPEWQIFRRSDVWFRIDGVVAPGADVGEVNLVEIEFSDGTITTATSEELIGDGDRLACRTDMACVAERVGAIAQDAAEAGARQQADALSDQLLTQSEYDDAVESFEQCLLDLSSVQLQLPAMILQDSPGATATLACYSAEVAFVEAAVVWQNSHLLTTWTPGNDSSDSPEADYGRDLSQLVDRVLPVTQEVAQVSGVLVWQGALGPEPDFDVAALGEEVVIKQIDPSNFVIPTDLIGRGTKSALGSDDLISLGEIGGAQIGVHGFADELCIYVGNFTTVTGGGSCGPYSSDPVTLTQTLLDPPIGAWFGEVGIDESISVVVVTLSDDSQMWQRPVASTIFFTIPDGLAIGGIRYLDAGGSEVPIEQNNEELASQIRAVAREHQATEAISTLFAGGVSEVELAELWDGYPYGLGERDQRIEQYQSDFAWIQNGEISVEVNLYLQFGNPEFFTPIVTVQSAIDPEVAAVFVMGLGDDELSFGRIPEVDEQTDGSLPGQIWARDDSSITVPGVGVEGGVFAFVNGQSLETSSDYEAATTEIVIPPDLPLPAHITIVMATPEVAAASTLRLEPFVGEIIGNEKVSR